MPDALTIAWFSPMPPVRSGVATNSAELVAGLRGSGLSVDVFVDEPVAKIAPGTQSAHDFVWKHRRRPYDLTVYQLGNSSHHDYEWAYAFRVPGLAVLHDTHLHHARAAALLRTGRAADYRAEFAWNHPDLSPDLAEIAVAGFDSQLYYQWPMVRTLLTASRLTAVHGERTAARLREACPGAPVESIRLGHGVTLTPERARAARARIRAKYGIAEDAVLFGCFGGLTPEKRIPQILAAMRSVIAYAPSARLLLGGAAAAHYDVARGIRARGLEDRVLLGGYLETDDDLTDHLAACDVSLNLRWPTARETSGTWLRALAAGRATIVTDLVHLTDVPSLDPRGWTMNAPGPGGGPEAVCVAVDILDEDHSLRLAMRRLATDAGLRDRLGHAAVAWWTRHHSVAAMLEDYRRVIAAAVARTVPDVTLPDHLRNSGAGHLEALIEPFGIGSPLPGIPMYRSPQGHPAPVSRGTL